MQVTFDGHRFYIADDVQQLIGQTSLIILNQSKVWLIEQTFVAPNQDAKKVATLLLQTLIAQAQAASVTLRLLDPFAKAYFSSHPEAQSLLAPHELPSSTTPH